MSHVDLSKAHTVQESKISSDVRTRVDVCLEMIEAIKQNRAPSGVAIDSSKVSPDEGLVLQWVSPLTTPR